MVVQNCPILIKLEMTTLHQQVAQHRTGSLDPGFGAGERDTKSGSSLALAHPFIFNKDQRVPVQWWKLVDEGPDRGGEPLMRFIVGILLSRVDRAVKGVGLSL